VTDLELSNAELRGLIVAGKRIVKLNFGKRTDPVLPIVRRVLRQAREWKQVATATSIPSMMAELCSRTAPIRVPSAV
jgi:hypothetical protein